jgi:hypothetical protein
LDIPLRIAPLAVEFIRSGSNEGQPHETVIVITGMVLGTSPEELPMNDLNKRSLADLVEMGKDLLSRVPSKFMVKYVIGTKELERVPEEDVHVIDGVKCYLPKHLIPVIGARVIVLENGVLEFEPRLGPVEFGR